LVILRSPFMRPVIGLGAASVALLVGSAAPSEAASGCRDVRGFYVDHATSENCTSPVGLCITGTYSGQIRGDFRGCSDEHHADGRYPNHGGADLHV